MNLLYIVIAVGLTIAIYVAVPAVARGGEKLWRASARIARVPWLAEAIVFLVALALAAIPSIIWSVPLPVQPDEMSYLLAADTFAHGRLTNPPHAMPELFETAATIQSPTYASKYPPALGLVMALPLKLFHLPILGIWISGALACAAVVWMLRAIVPTDQPQWSLVGGLLAAMHPLVAAWNQSYWGGNVSMIGGAMLLGAAFRVAVRTRASDGLIAGIGLSILALSRPFEGAVTGAMVVIAAIFLFRISFARWLTLAAWACAALVPTFAFLAYDNSRVTNDWKLFPHQLYDQQYMVSPRFFAQELPTPPIFHSEVVRNMATYELAEYNAHQGWRNYLHMLPQKLSRLTQASLFPPTILIAVVAGIIVVIRGKEFQSRSLWIALAVVLLLPAIHLALIVITRIPYFAPAFAGLFVLLIAGARAIARFCGAVVTVATLLVAQLTACISQMPKLNSDSHPTVAVVRAHDRAKLANLPGKQLVLVRYPPGYTPLFDFVFNDADIDESRVVFARSIDPPHDRAAMELFHDRAPWLLEFDEPHYSLAPIAR